MGQPTMEELRALLPVKGGKQRGLYAAPAGTGPAGKTCQSCAFQTSTGGNKRYPKCGRVNYTCGDATTIRVRTPACRHYADDTVQRMCWECRGRSPRMMEACAACNSTGLVPIDTPNPYLRRVR